MPFDEAPPKAPKKPEKRFRKALGEELLHAFDGMEVFVPVDITPDHKRLRYRLGVIACACGDMVRARFKNKKGAEVEEWFRLPTHPNFWPRRLGDGLREVKEVEE